MSQGQERKRRRQARGILTTMRRTYGVPATLYSYDPGTFNPQTGKRTSDTITPLKIKKFISFSVEEKLQFEYDISFLAANKNFTYGGTFEIGDRIAIIGYDDLPSKHVINQDDYVVYNGERYNMTKILKLDHELGFLLNMRRTQGELLGQVIELSVEHCLTFTQHVYGKT